MAERVSDEKIPAGTQDLFVDGHFAPAAIHNWAANLVRTRPSELEKKLDLLETAGFLRTAEIKARVAFWRGWLAHDRSDLDAAIASHQYAWDYFRRKRLFLDQARTAHALAASFKHLGYFDQALDWADKGLQAATAIENQSIRAAIMANTGEVLYQLYRYEEAETCLNQAAEASPSDITRAVIAFRLGEIYLATGRPAEALELATKGLHQAERLGQESFHGQAIAMQATALAANGRIKEAKGQFVKAVRMIEKAGKSYTIAETLLKFGKVCQEHGDAGSAQAFFERALALSLESNTRYLESKSHFALAGVFEANGNWQAACEHLNKHIRIREAFFERRPEEALKRLAATRAIHDAQIYRKLYDRISAIAEAGREITSVLDIKLVQDKVFAVVKKIMTADTFGLAIHTPGSTELVYSFMLKEGGRLDARSTDINGHASFAAWCFRNDKEILINDIDKEYRKYVTKPVWFGKPNERTQSLLYCPLRIKEKIIGIITVQAFEKNAYSRHDIEGLKAIALYVAIAIENARLYNEVERVAAHDVTTGVFNRHAIISAAEKEHDRHQRYKNVFSLVLLKINNLKIINTSLGHKSGDSVLRHAAEQVAKRSRTVDQVGRFGGEEFLIVLPETGREGVQKSARDIYQALASQHCPVGDNCSVEVDYRLAHITLDSADMSLDDSLRRLSLALGKAVIGQIQSEADTAIVDANQPV